MSDFSTFKNRWTITGKLRLITPMRIGGGQNAGAYSLSQSPVLLSYDKQTDTAHPYIPGSSLKGVLRSTLERTLRTFDEGSACVAVTGRGAKVKALCGKCLLCSIFGSQESGASIRVNDAHLSDSAGNSGFLEERPHCATLYDTRTDPYEMKTRLMTRNNNKVKIPATILRMEEIIPADTSFDIKITLDNVSEEEAGFIVLALNEFNNKRCFIGGGVSRGNGFADVYGIRVIKTMLSSDTQTPFKLEEEQLDPFSLCDAARNHLSDIDNKEDVRRQDFDVYFAACSDEKLEGYVVVKYHVWTDKPFRMPGVDEVTVTDRGNPIIPGSTVKGFLRHKLIENGTSAGVIDDLFGSTKGHRSRLLISDAIPMNDFAGRDMIPQSTELSMWVVFDNVKKEDLMLISNTLKGSCRITGSTMAETKKDSGSSYNMLTFQAKELHKFTTEKFIRE